MFSVVSLRRFASLAALLLGVLVLAGCSSAEQRAQAYYQHGLDLDAKGEPAKAALEFRNALKLKSDFTDAFVALGKVEEEQGDYDVAVQAYASAAEQSPTNIAARVRLARILLAAGQVDAALKYADEANTISATDPSALIAKAAIELKLDNRGEAVRLSQAALAQEPKYTDALMVLASERLMASDPAGALRFLDQAADETDSNFGLQILRLSVLDALGDQPGVEHLFGKLIQLFPDNGDIRDALARWYMGKGRNADAEGVMRTFAADRPKDDNALLKLVAFLNTQSGSAAALDELQKAIADRSKSGGDTFGLQMSLARLQFSTHNENDAIALMRSLVDGMNDAKKQNQARVQLANMLVATNATDQAELVASAVLTDDPKNTDALAARASARLAEGKDADAIDDLGAALNEAPDDARLHGLLAQAYEKSGSVVLADDQYAKTLELDQDSPQAALPMAQFLLRYGRTEEAVGVLERARKRVPSDRTVLELLAQLKLASADWAGAQDIANSLRQLDKTKDDLAANRISAAALGGQQQYADSIKLLEASTSNTTDRQVVLSDLVRAYVHAGKQGAAEAFLKSILQSDPANVQAQILLGSVYVASDQPDLAEGAFKQAAAADTGVVGKAALGQYYLTVGKFAEAEQAARAGLQQDASSIALHLQLATVLERQERFDDAIAEYETLFKLQPESTIAANDLASLLSERRGDKQALDRAYQIAQRFQNSDIPQFVDTLGWIYYLRGDYASALPLEKAAAEKLPNVALVQYHLGMTLKQLGQRELSVASINKAIALSPPLIASDLGKANAALQELQVSTSTSSALAQ